MCPFFIEIPPTWLTGGLWILWKSTHEFRIEIVTQNNRYIIALLKIKLEKC